MSVYFLAARVTKTRYTLKGALLATLAGTVRWRRAWAEGEERKRKLIIKLDG